MKRMLKLIEKHGFLISVALFSLIFIFTRYPFYVDIALPYVFDDAKGYVMGMEAFFSEGKSTRTLGYPIFMTIPYLLSSKGIAIVFFQSLTFFLSCIFFIHTIYKKIPVVTIPVAIALIIFASSVEQLHHETALLSESLFVCCLLMMQAFIVLSFKNRFRKNKYFIGLGFFMTAAIVVRPVGVFLIPVFVIMMGYMLWRRYPKITLAYLWSPLITYFAFKLLLSSVGTKDNVHLTDNRGSINATFIIPTTAYLEVNDDYPAYLNNAILTTQAQISKEDKNILNTSWNPRLLQKTYFKYKYFLRRKVLDKNLKANENYTEKDLIADYKKIGKDAIIQHPKLYFKWVYTFFIHYFRSLDVSKRTTYPFLSDYKRCMQSRIGRYFQDEKLKTGIFANALKIPMLHENQANKMLKHLRNSNSHKMNQAYSLMQNFLFKNMLWIWIYFTVLALSLFKLIRSKFRNTHAFIVFISLLSTLFSAILISMVHDTFIRYSYPLSYSYYLALAFLPLLFMKNKLSKKKRRIEKVTV